MSDTKTFTDVGTFGCFLAETGKGKVTAALSELSDTKENRLLLNMHDCGKTTTMLGCKPFKAGRKVQKALDALRPYYDHILIEAPPTK